MRQQPDEVAGNDDSEGRDRVRIMPADAAATVGNGLQLGTSEEPFEATVITYEGKARYSSCMILAFDPTVYPREIRCRTNFNETAFPKLTKGLFIMPETPCELIAAASGSAP